MATYTIKKGDTLSSIAKANGTTVAELASSNNISDVNKIYSGQTLNIGGSSTSSVAPAQQTGSTTVNTSTNPTSDIDTAYTNWQSVLNNKPASYQSQYSDQISSYLDKILNREKFSYDAISDPLYQNYKDQYVNLGKNAMMDTMANAATLTGGYGNSYASTAGNQAYQSYLQGLNDIVPDLYNSALSQYNNEGTDLYNQLSALQSAESEDYAKYQDKVNDYYNKASQAQSVYDMLYGNDYNERQFDYEKQQDALNRAASSSSSGSSGTSTGTDLGISDVMTSTQLKTLATKYDEGGSEGVTEWLDKLDLSDEESAIIYDYMTKELGYDIDYEGEVKSNTTGTNASQFMTDYYNMLGTQQMTKSQAVNAKTYDQAVQLGVPVIEEELFNAYRHTSSNSPYSGYKDYEDYIKQMVNQKLGYEGDLTESERSSSNGSSTANTSTLTSNQEKTKSARSRK